MRIKFLNKHNFVWKFFPIIYFSFLLVVNSLFDLHTMFFLVPLFFWAVYSPPNFYIFPVFILSFVQDFVTSIPFGTSGIEWFSLFYFFSSQKNFLQKVSFIWQMASFGIFLLIDITVYFLIFSKTFHAIENCFGFFITLGSYPFLMRFLFFINLSRDKLTENG